MNRKFTLMELLVIAATIGILVTLLLPSLNKAREKAVIAVCLSNQKQMAIAYTLYSANNNHLAVAHRWYNSHSGTKGTHGWCSDAVEDRELNAYLADPEISHCPADKGDPRNS
jgi:competence protein ComGC